MRIGVTHVAKIQRRGTMSSYIPLFLALVKRKGYSCDISGPQLVNGSATPPPSRRYPGLVCYMVTITVNKVEYHGYGPTAALARQAAAFEAYKVLAPVLRKDVPSSEQGSGEQDEDSASVSTIDDISSVCSEPIINICTVTSQNADNGGEGTYQEEHCHQQTLTLVHQDSKEVFTGQANEFDGEKKKWVSTGSERDGKLVNIVAPQDRQVSGGVAAVPVHDGFDRIRENSVGQLQEVFMKEFKVLPVFAESTQVSGPGGNVEFVCTVEINDLSARGIGQSKKLARRHAAENMLALMIDRGININPSSKKQRGNKKSNNSKRGWTEPNRRSAFQRVCGQPHSKWNNCNRFVRCNSFPSDSHNTYHQHLHQVNPKQRGLLPLPFLPPLRVPEPDVVYKNLTDDESDTDCENGTTLSAGLCEVLPPNLQNDIHCFKNTRPQSLPSLLSDQGDPALTPTAPLDIKNSPSGAEQCQIQSPSAHVPPSGEFSDIASPFPAHSDPFQFTVRLPRFAESSLVGAPLLKKSPPWKELRRNSQLVPPSTDHIYHKAAAPSRHKIVTERSADIARPVQLVAREADQSSSLPVHPLFLSTPMVQYPAHLHPLTQTSPREGDSRRHAIQSVIPGNVSNDPRDDRSSDCDGVVLTSDISVGLPYEGPVSASLLPSC